MRYTQKDLRERLGFTRDMLRLYEKRGIIHPEIDPNNGYRYYDDWQVNLLWDCRYYQGMGFSLAEIKEILQRDSMASLEGRLSRRCDELARDLRIRELVLSESRRSLRMMHEVPELLGSFRLQHYEGCIFVPKRKNHEIVCEPNSEAVAFSNRYEGLVAPYFWFPDADDATYYWGAAMRREVYEALDAEVSERGSLCMRPCDALVTCVDAGERWSFGRHLFTGLFDEAQRRGLSPTGGVQGILVARVHDDGGYHRYVRAYLPVVF